MSEKLHHRELRDDNLMPQKPLPPCHERPVVAIIPAILVPFSPSPLTFQGYRACPYSR